MALFLSWMNMKSWIINGTYDFVNRLFQFLLQGDEVAMDMVELILGLLNI